MKRTKGFDGLRCLSIMLVILGHAQIIQPGESGSLRDNISYYYSGGAGVTIFFALSGFLITSLLLRERTTTGSINLKYFFIRRFLRLLPPLIPFYIGIVVFMSLGYIRESYLGLAASVFYVYNFIPKAKLFYSAELAHTWSLAVEEQFYLTWPILLRFFSNAKVYLFAGVVMLLSILSFFFLKLIPISAGGTSYLLGEVFFTSRWIIPAISPILLGCLAAFVLHYQSASVSAFFTASRSALLVVGSLLLPLLFLGEASVLLPLVFSIGVCAAILWISVNQRSILVRLLEWGPIRYVGLISYGLYVWQGFFVRSGQGFLPKIWLHDMPFNIPLAFLAAIVSYELLEKRVMAYKEKFRVSEVVEDAAVCLQKDGGLSEGMLPEVPKSASVLEKV